MTGTIVIQPVIMFLVQAAAQFSGWSGWSEFYRSF
jgi:hypothetical protein